MTTHDVEQVRSATTRLPTPEQAEHELNTLTAVRVYTAAVVLGTSERVVRDAIERGDLPAIRLGRNIAVPTAPLRRMLRIEG